jgi:hypothetical protein
MSVSLSVSTILDFNTLGNFFYFLRKDLEKISV